MRRNCNYSMIVNNNFINFNYCFIHYCKRQLKMFVWSKKQTMMHAYIHTYTQCQYHNQSHHSYFLFCKLFILFGDETVFIFFTSDNDLLRLVAVYVHSQFMMQAQPFTNKFCSMKLSARQQLQGARLLGLPRSEKILPCGVVNLVMNSLCPVYLQLWRGIPAWQYLAVAGNIFKLVDNNFSGLSLYPVLFVVL